MPPIDLENHIRDYMNLAWPGSVESPPPPRRDDPPPDDVTDLFAAEVSHCTPPGRLGRFPRKKTAIPGFLDLMHKERTNIHFEYTFSQRSYPGPEQVISIDWTGHYTPDPPLNHTPHEPEPSWHGTTTFRFDDDGKIERRWWEGQDIPGRRTTPDPGVSDVP